MIQYLSSILLITIIFPPAIQAQHSTTFVFSKSSSSSFATASSTLHHTPPQKKQENGLHFVVQPNGTTDCSQANDLINVRRVEQPAPSVLYALPGAELIKSTDGGKQWQPVDICDANNAIYADISFPSSTLGYVISRNRPNLFKTQDGGITWKRYLPKIDDSNLESFSVHFVNDFTGYMLAKSSGFGSYYTLYKTTDGGYSFNKLANSPHFLLDNYGQYLTQRIKPVFIGESTIIGYTEIVNNDNSILDRLAISLDGGVTWQKHLLPADGNIVNRLFATSATDIWLFARSTRQYKNTDDLFHTTDGGTTWIKISLPGRVEDQYRPTNIFDISFSDSQRGIIVGGQYGEYSGPGQRPAVGYICKTNDGGANWTVLTTEMQLSIQLRRVTTRAEQIVAFGTGLDDDNPGRTDRLTLTSTNLGSNWNRSNDLDNLIPYSLSFRTPKEGYMTGLSQLFVPDSYGQSTVYRRVNYYHRTQDGGISWQKVYLPENEQLFEVYFLNATIGFLTTQDAVWLTLDGGATWQRRMTPAPFLPLRTYSDNSIHYAEKYAKSYFITASTWLRISAANQVFKTMDGGNSWDQLSVPAFTDTPLFSFVDEQTGFCTGQQGSSNKQLYKTTNGGKTWDLVSQISTSTREISDMVFTDALTGYENDDAARITRDGGVTWNTISSIPYLGYTDIRLNFIFFNKRIGYFGGLYKTIDGGETWAVLPKRQTSIWPVTITDETTAYGLNTSIRHGSAPCNLVPYSGDTITCKGVGQSAIIQLASGTTSSPLQYKWFKLPENTPVPGQTTATLSLTNVSAYDIQSYYCVATSSCGLATSNILTLCGENAVFTLKSGNWSDSSVWSCDRIPTNKDRVLLKHEITLLDIYKASAYRLEFFDSKAKLRYNGRSSLLMSVP